MSKRRKPARSYGRQELEGAMWALEVRGEEGRDTDALHGALRSLGVDPGVAETAVRSWTGGRSNGNGAEATGRERIARATLVGVAIGLYLGTGEYDEALNAGGPHGARVVRTRDHHSQRGDTTTSFR